MAGVLTGIAVGLLLCKGAVEAEPQFNGVVSFVDEMGLVAPMSFAHVMVEIRRMELEDGYRIVLKEVDRCIGSWAISSMASGGLNYNQGLQEIHRSVKRALRLLKAETEGVVQFFELSRDQGHVKRGIFGDVTGIFATGASIYDAAQISSLAGDVRVDRGALVSHEKEIERLKRDLKEAVSLQEAEEIKTHFQVMVLPQIDKVRVAYRDLKQALYRLLSLQFSPAFMQSSKFVELAFNVSETVEKMGFKTLDRGVRMLAEAPLSYSFNTTILGIVFHVPIVRNLDYVMQLRKMLPAVAVSDDGTFLTFSPDKNYLAISGNGETHITLAESEVLSCILHNRMYLCPSLHIVYRKPVTCTAHLYFGNVDEALDLCEIKWSSQTDVAMQASLDHYLIRTRTDSKIQCEGNTLPRELKAGVTHLQIDSKCTLENDEFRIIPEKDLYRKQEIRNPIEFNLTDLEMDVSMYEDIKRDLDKIRGTHINPKLNYDGSSQTILIVCLIIFFVIVGGLTLVGFIGYKFLQKARDDVSSSRPEDVAAQHLEEPPAGEGISQSVVPIAVRLLEIA